MSNLIASDKARVCGALTDLSHRGYRTATYSDDENKSRLEVTVEVLSGVYVTGKKWQPTS
jgi:hypothetical protein